MLFKISLANIKKSFKDYAIYFFTLILGVAIFYVFNAIDSQTVLLDVTSSTYEIIKLMTNMLSGVSVFVSFILGFLIIYASRFLIKRRHKEFGIYLTLGMSKRKISLILFFETLFIGLISLVVGLGVGVVLSQFMSLLVANMFDADMTNFAFTFSSSASIKTIIYFAIMYLIVMFFNTYNISKCKLIDLLHSSKKNDEIKLKNPYLCIIIFIIAAIMLGYAYYLVTIGFEKLQDAKDIFIPIALGSVSTFLIFWSLSGLILRIITRIKSFYYKGLNSFVLRQFSSKINTTVFSITIICLMLFITICVLSASLTLKNSLQANVDELAPADIQMTKRVNLKKTDEYTEEEINNSQNNILVELQQRNIDIKQYFKEQEEINIYQTDDLTLSHTLGRRLDEIRKQFIFLQYETKEDILKISDYNKIARLYGIKEYSLNNDEYMIIADFQSMVDVRNFALANKETINLFGHVLKPKYQECQDGFIELSSQHINSGLIIVPDNIVSDEYIALNMIVANYDASSKKEKQAIEQKITDALTYEKYNNASINFNTKIDILEASIGLGALVTFIGLYLGIIFLMASAAILALKELSESSDNKERFRMIRKLGADEKMINKALFKQIFTFFALPLLLALIHSVFGIIFSIKILEIFGTKGLLPSIIMTSCFIVIIYGGYFLLTYLCSKNIIKEKY